MNNSNEQIPASDAHYSFTGQLHPVSEVHKVSALYPSHAEAEGIRQQLIENGFPPREVEILQQHSNSSTAEDLAEGGSDGVLKDVLVDGAIGTAVGTSVGAIGSIALMAANVTLFVASPLIAPLTMLGWFGSIGGVIGGAIGAERKHTFSELVNDAIKAGNALLVVLTHDEIHRERAKAIISESLKGRDEVIMESN